MSVRLYVGNLPKELERNELEAVFSDYNDLISVKVITDRKTGKCRGFGFVTVKTDEQADAIIEHLNGQEFKDSTLKIEKAMPRSKSSKEKEGSSTPTPSSAAPSGGNRRNNKNKSRRTGGETASNSGGATQPDPRWAEELEKLKQMLAAQTASS